MRSALIALLCLCVVASADYNLAWAPDFVQTANGGFLVWGPPSGAAADELVLWYEFGTNGNPVLDSSSYGNNGPAAGLTWASATNGMSTRVSFTTGSITSTVTQTKGTLFVCAATNGLWHTYGWAGGTAYYDGSAAAWANNLWTTNGSTIVWGGQIPATIDNCRVYSSTFNAAQMWATSQVLFAEIGVRNNYWMTNDADFKTGLVAAAEFKNIVQDGSSNNWALTQDAPTAVSVLSPATYPPNGSGAADFNGSANYVEFGNDSAFSFGDGTNDSGFTIIAWVNADDWTALRILAKSAPTSSKAYFLSGSASDVLVLALYDDSTGGAYARLGATLTGTQGDWVMVSSSYSGGSDVANVNLYTNDVLYNSGATTTGTYVAMEPFTTQLTVGKLSGAISGYANGRIGMVWLLRGGYPSSFISAVYNATKGAYGK